MHIEAFNEMHQRGRIEPETSAAQTDEEVAIISMAISLKRIADALENSDIGKQLSAIEFNTREVL